MSDIVVQYEGNLRCRSVHIESGTVVITDAPKDNGGKGGAFSPSDLLAVSLGSCMLSMMGLAALPLGLDLAGTTATVSKTMANAPRRVSAIVVHITVPQRIAADYIQRLEAAAKACPVHALLSADLQAPVTFEWTSSEF